MAIRADEVRAGGSLEAAASEITEFNYGKAVWGNDFSPGVGLPQLARFAELNQVVEIQGAN